MSDQDSPVTSQVPVTTQVPVAPQLPPELHPEDPDDEWYSGPPAQGFRLRAVTGGLLALSLLAGGFWIGAVVEKNHNGNSPSSSLSALASRFAAARSAAGGGSFSGAGSGATTGIVTGVQGQTLYITDSSGILVKVTISPSTQITRTSTSSLSGLQTGDTVVVAGSQGSGGSIDATTVRASAAGTPTAGPGGGGGGFFGGSSGG